MSRRLITLPMQTTVIKPPTKECLPALTFIFLFFTASEIEELKKEAAALRTIRNSVGTPEFAKMLFSKVFDSDIQRLCSMEDMWKSRKPPEPLKYDILARATDSVVNKAALLKDGQRVWSLEESLVMFNDSLDRLSKRVLEMREAEDERPIITFDKDDPDTLDFVAASANIRSTLFGIDRKSRFDIKQMAGNIIPAIATTNAIVAGLCVLQAYKIIKGEYDAAKEVFLTPFNDDRLLASDVSRAPNPNCPVCSAYQTSAYVDFERATLNDLVEGFVKHDLGFGEREFSLSNEVGTLYDPDETENLTKKLNALGEHGPMKLSSWRISNLLVLGIEQDSFLTVIDEDDDDPFVNVVINIQALKGQSDKPVKSTQADQPPSIPHRPKNETPPSNNGAVEVQEKPETDGSKLLKRARPDDENNDLVEVKKTKKSDAPSNDVVIIEDESGAIVIG